VKNAHLPPADDNPRSGFAKGIFALSSFQGKQATEQPKKFYSSSTANEHEWTRIIRTQFSESGILYKNTSSFAFISVHSRLKNP